MNDVLLCRRPTEIRSLRAHCHIDEVAAFGCPKPSTLLAYTPYFSKPDASPGLLAQLAFMPHARELTYIALSLGDENTVAIADITSKLYEFRNEFINSSAGLYNKRMGGFTEAVKQYQAALLQYRDAMQSSPANKTIARQQAQMAFDDLQKNFQLELKKVTANARARRGMVLTDFERGSNIATSSRIIAKLSITDQIQANNLVKFAKHSKYLGYGLASIDFAGRIGNIQNEYRAGGNWHREMFIESSSFFVGAVAGELVVKVGAAGLGFLVVATPIGWAGLVVGGLAVAGTAAGTAMYANNWTKTHAGARYDRIMKELNR